MTTTIYHRPHTQRAREAAFLQALLKSVAESTLEPNSYALDPSFLDHLIEIEEVVSGLKRDTLLPTGKRIPLIKELERLPSKVRIALTPAQISCDFVLISKKQAFFMEFHEEQHRNLSVARASPVYSAAGSRRDVPRYVQRFLRDIWRVRALPNFSIFWFDWFSANASAQLKLLQGFKEFSNAGCFTFEGLLGRPNKLLHATAPSAAREQ